MADEKIAFLGTGLMGFPMASNLLRAGYAVTAWNRTASKAEPLAQQSARLAPSAAEAVAGADVIVAMLSDGPASMAVQADPGVRAALAKGALWIEMGSIKPEEARAESEDLASLGLRHIDAPVSGVCGNGVPPA